MRCACVFHRETFRDDWESASYAAAPLTIRCRFVCPSICLQGQDSSWQWGRTVAVLVRKVKQKNRVMCSDGGGEEDGNRSHSYLQVDQVFKTKLLSRCEYKYLSMMTGLKWTEKSGDCRYTQPLCCLRSAEETKIPISFRVALKNIIIDSAPTIFLLPLLRNCQKRKRQHTWRCERRTKTPDDLWKLTWRWGHGTEVKDAFHLFLPFCWNVSKIKKNFNFSIKQNIFFKESC